MLKKLIPEYNPQNDVYKTVLEEGEARNRKQEATTFNSHLSLGRPGDRN